jgi:hypothetical protein
VSEYTKLSEHHNQHARSFSHVIVSSVAFTSPSPSIPSLAQGGTLDPCTNSIVQYVSTHSRSNTSALSRVVCLYAGYPYNCYCILPNAVCRPHLGHTYCLSCVEKLIDDIDETSTCPECRNDFEFEDIRPLYLKPTNNSSETQTSPRHSSASDQEGYIKQAKHIARRLQKLNANSPAESVKNAADVIEQVAMIQCKAAQACPLT